MDNWEGKYVPAKLRNIWEAFIGGCFILITRWISMPSKHKYSQTWGSFSSSLQYCKVDDWSKYSSVLLNTIRLFPFLKEWLGFEIWVHVFFLLFATIITFLRCNFDEKELVSTWYFFKWVSTLTYKIKGTKVRKTFEDETVGTDRLVFNFWRDK